MYHMHCSGMFIGLFPQLKKHPNLQQSCSVGMLGAKPGTYNNKSPSLPPSLPLSLWPRSELSPDKKKWEEIGDVVESKRNKLKKSEHSPLLLDIETFEFPKWRYELNFKYNEHDLCSSLVINEPNTFSNSGNCNHP